MRYESDGKGPRYEPTPDWALRHMNKGRSRRRVTAAWVQTAVLLVALAAFILTFR